MVSQDPRSVSTPPPRNSFGSDDGARTRSSSLSSLLTSPSYTPAGAQTPAIARPLLRRPTSPLNLRQQRQVVSEETVPQLQSSLRKAQGWLHGETTFTPRLRTDSTESQLGPLPQPTAKETAEAEADTDSHPLHSATQIPRPPGPHRRISHEVHEREHTLRAELERLRVQVKDQEERKQEEMRTVEFAINRIAETQMNHMKVQQILLEKVAALNLQAKEAKLELKRAKKEAKRCAQGVLEEDCCGREGEGGCVKGSEEGE